MACTYAQASTIKRLNTTQRQSPAPDDMQARIDRLENLVLSLVTDGAQSAKAAAPREVMLGSVNVNSSETSQNLDSGQGARGTSVGDEESDTEKVTKSFGILKVDNQNQKSYYISEAHWMSILNDVGTPGLKHLIKS